MEGGLGDDRSAAAETVGALLLTCHREMREREERALMADATAAGGAGSSSKCPPSSAPPAATAAGGGEEKQQEELQAQQHSGSGSGLEDFEVEDRLGKGAFGVVHRARRRRDGRLYVIKTIPLSDLGDARAEAVNEASLLASITSPFVVRYYESFVGPSSCSANAGGEDLHIVMEYCNRGDLQRILHKLRRENCRSVAEAKIWSIFVQVALGLHHLHGKQILHRDIKAANVFIHKDEVTGQQSVKIGDLGVAKLLSSTSIFATTLVGTPYYLSPELCQNKPYDERSDVWSLGVLLYQCCTLRLPFEAESPFLLMTKIIKGKYDPVSPRHLSPLLCELVKALLTPNSDARPALRTVFGWPAIQERVLGLGFDLPPDVPAAPVPVNPPPVPPQQQEEEQEHEGRLLPSLLRHHSSSKSSKSSHHKQRRQRGGGGMGQRPPPAALGLREPDTADPVGGGERNPTDDNHASSSSSSCSPPSSPPPLPTLSITTYTSPSPLLLLGESRATPNTSHCRASSSLIGAGHRTPPSPTHTNQQHQRSPSSSRSPVPASASSPSPSSSTYDGFTPLEIADASSAAGLFFGSGGGVSTPRPMSVGSVHHHGRQRSSVGGNNTADLLSFLLSSSSSKPTSPEANETRSARRSFSGRYLPPLEQQQRLSSQQPQQGTTEATGNGGRRSPSFIGSPTPLDDHNSRRNSISPVNGSEAMSLSPPTFSSSPPPIIEAPFLSTRPLSTSVRRPYSLGHSSRPTSNGAGVSLPPKGPVGEGNGRGALSPLGGSSSAGWKRG